MNLPITLKVWLQKTILGGLYPITTVTTATFLGSCAYTGDIRTGFYNFLATPSFQYFIVDDINFNIYTSDSVNLTPVNGNPMIMCSTSCGTLGNNQPAFAITVATKCCKTALVHLHGRVVCFV